jgi:hypothetical protein
MSSTPASDAAAASRESVRSAWLVIFMAVCTSTLRIASWAGGEIMLLYFYGWAAVVRDHLHITRMKPQIVVSNGDVLPGIGFYHYSVEVVIWLPLAFGLITLICYTLLPKWQLAFMRVRERNQRVSAVVLVWVLALFFLVSGLLPMGDAMALAAASVAGALIWAWKLPYGDDVLG